MAMISSSVFPRIRSTALLKTVSGSEAIFTLAMASMFRGMFPLEKALVTEISIGKVSREVNWTVSMMGTLRVRPPITDRYPMISPLGNFRFRPVRTAAMLGGTMTMRDLMVRTATTTTTRSVKANATAPANISSVPIGASQVWS